MKWVECPSDKPVDVPGGPMASCQVLIDDRGHWQQHGYPPLSHRWPVQGGTRRRDRV